MDTSADPIVFITRLNGAYIPSAEDLAATARPGTQIEAAPIARIYGVTDVALQYGRTVRFNGLFTQPHT